MADLIRLTGQMSSYWRPATEADRLALEGVDTVKASGDKSRSGKQNNALHKFCRDLAKVFNDAGLDQRVVLKPEVEITWTHESVINHIWRPVQKIMTGHDSTVDPTTKEYTEIQEVIIRHLASKHGVEIEWPCIDNQRTQR